MTEPQSWKVLAARALQAAVRGDMVVAGRLVERIGAECGSDNVALGMLAWIDTLVKLVPEAESHRRIGFQEVTEGRVGDADHVPPHVAWAGRLVSARARMDHAIVEALIDSVPDDVQWARNVSAVLQMVALMIASEANTAGKAHDD